MTATSASLKSIPFDTLSMLLKLEKENTGGKFTVKSKLTGKDYTYSIKRRKFKGVWNTHIYVEHGYMNFQYLGHFKNGLVLMKGNEVETPTAKGISWILNHLEDSKLPAQAELFHLGCCVRCGKTLTDAKSIEAGLGPHCRK